MSFSDSLNNLRVKRGLTQQKLAILADVSQTSIYQWEKGLRNPKIEQIDKLANALDAYVTVNDDGEAILIPWEELISTNDIKTDNTSSLITDKILEKLYNNHKLTESERQWIENKINSVKIKQKRLQNDYNNGHSTYAGPDIENNEHSFSSGLKENTKQDGSLLVNITPEDKKRNQIEQKILSNQKITPEELQWLINYYALHPVADTFEKSSQKLKKLFETLVASQPSFSEIFGNIKQEAAKLADSLASLQNSYEQLNDAGQEKAGKIMEQAADQVDLLTKIPEYQKTPATQDTTEQSPPPDTEES